MTVFCKTCGYEPARHPLAERLKLFRCDICGNTRCETCLRGVAEAAGDAVGEDDDISLFMRHHPVAPLAWCPSCQHGYVRNLRARSRTQSLDDDFIA